MASRASSGGKPSIATNVFADRALLVLVTFAGIGSAALLMFMLESPFFAAGFAALFVSALGIALIFARRQPVKVAAKSTGPDRALIRSAIESATMPVAVTDRDGVLIAANHHYEREFRDAPTPPALPLPDDGVNRLTNAGRTAWRDGRGSAASLVTQRGRYDAVVERGGEMGDFLVWRFAPAAAADLVGDARRLLESGAGKALGIAGVMGVLVDADGKMIAANQVFRHRALDTPQERIRSKEFTALLETGEDELLRLAREGEDGPPLRLVQVPLGADGGEDPLLIFLLDDIAGPGQGADRHNIQALLGMLPLGLALAERDGRFLYMNSAFRRAAGLADDAQPVYPGDLVVDEDKTAVANAVRRFANSASISADIALRLKHQPDETVAMTVAGAPGLGDAAVLLSLKDNSEDEKLKRQVAQATKMQAVGQLAGGVAHDFNNILTAIIGHCDLMLMRHTPGDSDYDDIQQIKSNSNRAAGLTRQLLAFSRQQTLRPQILQLPDVVSEVSNLLKRLLGETVSLDIRHGRNLGPVRADPGQLEQVIVNLAVNARDAIQARTDNEGRGVLKLETFAVTPREVDAMGHDVMPPAEYTAFRLTDTGIGIAPEALGKIFEPFYTTKEVGKGTGLGLSTVYGIVKQSGGYIFADSEVGKGTSFTVYLPVHGGEEDVRPDAPTADREAETVEQQESKTAKAPETVSAEPWGSGTILVVEDEDMVRAVAERALSRQGYAVVTARDGEDALEIIAERQDFDLILSDVVMPGMDGPAMAQELRATMPDVPILFMSGYAEEQLRKSIDIEQVHFLPKPFSVQKLAEAVQSILDTTDS